MKPHITYMAGVWTASWKGVVAVGPTPTKAIGRLYRAHLGRHGRKGLWPAALVHSMIQSYA